MCRPIVKGTHYLGCNHFQKTTVAANIDCYNPRCTLSDRHPADCTSPDCIKEWGPDIQQVIHRSNEKCWSCRQHTRR